tara:strand:+ start:1035 stop:1643 length:609 start_codon:yes stop_codon:yes gene_type:complete
MIFIFDNFLDDPYQLRNYALKSGLEYREDETSVIPGIRHYDLITRKDKTDTSNIILRKIQQVTGECTKSTHCGFHLVSAKDYCGNVHIDIKSKYAAVLFLTPNPKKNSGTRIFNNSYEYKWIGEHDFLKKTQQFNNSKKSWLDRIKYSYHMNKYEKQFGKGMDVENKFNRLLIYKSPVAHKALHYFGDEFKNSRLTFFAFFN